MPHRRLQLVEACCWAGALGGAKGRHNVLVNASAWLIETPMPDILAAIVAV